MMTNSDATTFIQSRHHDLSKGLDSDESEKVFETVTVRLEAKNALMLKELAHVYKFPISTSFTDIISKHLVDILASLTKEDFDEVVAPFEKKRYNQGSALEQLQQSNILPETDFRHIWGIPNFSGEEDSSDDKDSDNEQP
jgi:predicted transcriptional regulator